MNGVTDYKCQALLPPLDHAVVASRWNRVLDRQPRASCRYSTYDHSLLPTTAEKQLFMLTYLQHNPIPAVPGPLMEMPQSHANTWIHFLYPVLNRTLTYQELLPSHTVHDLIEMLATARTMEVPLGYDGSARALLRWVDQED